MTPAEHAEQRARDYVRDRGWRQEPPSWEEVAELLIAMREHDEDYLHIDDICVRIAGVAMVSKSVRRALADALGLHVDDLTPRAVS